MSENIIKQCNINKAILVDICHLMSQRFYIILWWRVVHMKWPQYNTISSFSDLIQGITTSCHCASFYVPLLKLVSFFILATQVSVSHEKIQFTLFPCIQNTFLLESKWTFTMVTRNQFLILQWGENGVSQKRITKEEKWIRCDILLVLIFLVCTSNILPIFAKQINRLLWSYMFWVFLFSKKLILNTTKAFWTL